MAGSHPGGTRRSYCRLAGVMQKSKLSIAMGMAIIGIQRSLERVGLDRPSVVSAVRCGSSPRGSAEACLLPAEGGGGQCGNHAPLPGRNGADIRKLRGTCRDTSVSAYVTVGYRVSSPWISLAITRSAQFRPAHTMASRRCSRAAPPIAGCMCLTGKGSMMRLGLGTRTNDGR